MQHDVVVVQRVAVRAGDPAQGSLESRIVERVDLPAGGTDEVVMVLATGVRGLEARDAEAEVDAMHEAEIGELVEHPVDACEADGAALGAKLVEQLLGRETAILCGEVRDHRIAGAAGACAGAAQLRAGVLFPVGRARLPPSRE